MMKNLEILVKRFVADVEHVLRQQTMMAVQASVGRRNAKEFGAPNGKRSVGELDSVKQKIVAFLKKTPGQSSEEIQRALHRDGAELTLPIKQLVDAKLLRHEGVARGRRYWVK